MAYKHHSHSMMKNKLQGDVNALTAQSRHDSFPGLGNNWPSRRNPNLVNYYQVLVP